MKYLKQFVIGSSYLIVAPFFYGFYKLKRKTYSYFNYTLVAPLWFGLWNVISLIIAEYLNLSLRMRFFLVSIITYLCVMLYNLYNNVYNFTKNEWYKYYILILFAYMFTWNIMIYYIEKLMS